MEHLIEKVSRGDPEYTEVVIPRHGNNMTNEVVQLVEALKPNPHVRNLNCWRCVWRAPEFFPQLAALFRVNRVIQYLTFPDGTCNEELLLITESLRENTTLTALDLEFCDISGRRGGEIIQTLLFNNGTLTEIGLLDNQNLGNEGVTCISQALRNDRCLLQKLNLSSCGIGDVGARELSDALKNNNVLEELDISCNLIFFIGSGHVFEMLETNSCLRVLLLACNRLANYMTGHETVGDIVSRALQHNTSLRELNLGDCGLSAADLSRIFRMLGGDNQTLARLCISRDEMNEISTNDFARLLPETKVLEEIKFSWYEGVSATVLRGFLQGLQDNKSLVRIQDLCDHHLRGEGSIALWRMWSTLVTRRNRMRPLLEPAQPVPPSLWPDLLNWCNTPGRHGSESTGEAHASLIHRVLCARPNDICGLAAATSGGCCDVKSKTQEARI